MKGDTDTVAVVEAYDRISDYIDKILNNMPKKEMRKK